MKHLFCCIAAFLLLTSLPGCNAQGSHNTTQSDTVTLSSRALADSLQFALKSGGHCRMSVIANITFPEKFGTNTETLQRLFAQMVLEASDSLNFNDALDTYAARVLNYDGEGINEPNSDFNDPSSNNIKIDYNRQITIYPVFNRLGIISFCKDDIVTKNGTKTLREHTYYNFDLKEMAPIDINSIFTDDGILELTGLLRAELLAMNNVQNEDELRDIGYYNLDNLTPTNNFYISEKGITWSYKPNDLAIIRIGEPKIFISLDLLKPFLTENSPLNHL